MGPIWKYLVLQDSPHNIFMSEKDGGPCRGTKAQIIYWLIYNIIGEVKWANTCFKMVAKVLIVITLVLQVVAK